MASELQIGIMIHVSSLTSSHKSGEFVLYTSVFSILPSFSETTSKELTRVIQSVGTAWPSLKDWTRRTHPSHCIHIMRLPNGAILRYMDCRMQTSDIWTESSGSLALHWLECCSLRASVPFAPCTFRQAFRMAVHSGACSQW